MPEHYITAGGKRLRCGRTTGTCAAMAAAGAVRLLLTGRAPDLISLNTPRDWMVEAPLLDCVADGETAACSVEKDGGDDVDATHGLPIRATVRRRAEGGTGHPGGTRGGPGHPAGAGPAGGGGGHQLGAPEDDRPGGGGRGGGPGLRRGTGDHHLRPWGGGGRPPDLQSSAGGGGGHLHPGHLRHRGAHERPGPGGDHRPGAAQAAAEGADGWC